MSNPVSLCGYTRVKEKRVQNYRVSKRKILLFNFVLLYKLLKLLFPPYISSYLHKNLFYFYYGKKVKLEPMFTF